MAFDTSPIISEIFEMEDTTNKEIPDEIRSFEIIFGKPLKKFEKACNDDFI